MAPMIKLVNQGSKYLSPRRTIDPNCYGWDCLSDSGQAGVVLMVVACVFLGLYMWRKLGTSEDGTSRRFSMAANLAALAHLSRPNSPSNRRRSHRISGSIYSRSHRISGSIYRRSHSRAASLASIREDGGRRDSDSSINPRRPSSQHVEMADLTNENRQPNTPVIPPPPGPAPVLWTGGLVPIFIHPLAYTPTPSNNSHVNEVRFSSAACQPVTFQPQQGPFQYGPNPIPPFPNGMPPFNYPSGPFPLPHQGAGFRAIDNQADMSHSGAADHPAENRRRSWFPFIKGTKRLGGGHARSISESAASSRQPLSLSEFSDLHLPPMRERGRSHLRRQPSIRLIDRSTSPQPQPSPRPYSRIGWHNASPGINHDEDDNNQSDQSEGIHPSELSFPSVGTSMRVHDGIPSPQVTSSNLNRDPHFEEYSPERRRQHSLKRFRNPTRDDDSDTDDEDAGMPSSASSAFRERRRHRRQRPYSTSVLPPMPPSPPSSDIQFPSPESQRVNVTFVEPRRERDGLGDRDRERRGRERTPAPPRRIKRSQERIPPTRWHREWSQERTPPARRRRERSCERGRDQRARENHRSRNNLLGRLRAFRMEMRGGY